MNYFTKDEFACFSLLFHFVRKNKETPSEKEGAFGQIQAMRRLSASFNLTRTKATGANSNGLVFTVDDSADLSDISLPSSAGFAVRVGNVVTECNTLVAVHAFCHIYTPPI